MNHESRTKSTELQNREKKVRTSRDELQAAKFQLQELTALQKAMDDCKSESEFLTKEIEVVEKKISDIAPRTSHVEEQLRRCRVEIEAAEKDAQSSLNILQSSMNQINTSQREIQRYIDDNGAEKLKQCNSSIKSLESRLDTTRRNLTAANREIQSNSQKLSEVLVVQRRIDDNLKLRQFKKELLAAENNTNDLVTEINTYDSVSIAETYRKNQKHFESLLGERAGLVGELKQLEEQIKRLKHELTSDYKDIDQQYVDHNLELRTKTLSNSDLDVYSKALDNAIRKYHSLKMEEINKIIKELWITTYKGNDIDTIEIRSEVADAAAGVKGHNYRVVMIKGENELDVRGRCSAGQKVLASLIIRLTLAETFGLNCGILALDEPTTNLDKENIESLAASLGNIIEARRKQSNFQLVIITHDEEFLQALGRTEFANYYFRVFKDEEGHSTIERKAISKRAE